MPKPLSSAQLHLCQTRASIPGSAEERERDYAAALHKAGPVLIRRELDRIKPDPAPDNLLSRIFQALDILLGRRQVYVERRHSADDVRRVSTLKSADRRDTTS